MSCETCNKQRAIFMEPCPACNETGTYVTHQSQGVDVCRGCDVKICTNCFQGCRYTCKLAQAALFLPVPPKLERQLTESKWEDGELALQTRPERTEMTVGLAQGHIYKVVRSNGKILRIHGDETCVRCGRLDIRYPDRVYDGDIFVCGKCK